MFNPHTIQGSYREEAAKRPTTPSASKLQTPTSKDLLSSTGNCAQQFYMKIKKEHLDSTLCWNWINGDTKVNKSGFYLYDITDDSKNLELL